MRRNVSLFDGEDNKQPDLFQEQVAPAGKIEVVQMNFVGADAMSWEDLFEGFDRLYAITYSSGIRFISALLLKFSYAEIIFGFDEVISYNLQEIMAYQLKTIERLRTISDQSQADLLARIDSNSLKMYVARQKLSHEKIYLLEADDGRKRVVMGSANMSHSAFSGKQRENVCYVEGEPAFNWYKQNFEQLKAMSSDDIPVSALQLADDDDNLNEIPVLRTVKVKKAMVIEPDTELKEEIRFGLDVKNLANKLTPFMPKADKKGKVMLSLETVLQTRRRLVDANIEEKAWRSEYPQMVIDIPLAEVYLNDRLLDLQPSRADIQNDVELFLDYMEGYKKFHGDVDGMQSKYYAFANWFFTSPFMASMRNMAVKYNQQLLPYPVFGLMYGKSKAGKTSFLETLLQMMIGQKTKMAAPDFTRSNINELKNRVKGAPIIVDDLTQNRFNQHAVETIKNEEFGIAENNTNYPAVVISANEDVKAVSPEVIRRTVLCHVQAGLKNTEIMKNSVVRKVQKNIGTAFYREYLRRMLGEVPVMLETMKDDDIEEPPDILEVSSQVILAIIGEHAERTMPDYIHLLTLEDYFSEQVTGSQAIKTIMRAWEVNRKAFEVYKRRGQISYNAGQTWEAERIFKELPEDLGASRSREYIVMDLDKASRFFNIDFKKQSKIWTFFSR